MRLRYLSMLGILLLIGEWAFGQTVINPQAGLNLSFLSTEPEINQAKSSEEGRVGYQLGGFIRMPLGERSHFDPGFFWYYGGIRISSVNSVSLQSIEDDIYVHQLCIPAMIGFDLSDPAAFNIRLNGGGAYTMVASVPDNAFGFTKDDLETSRWSARAGVGLDFTPFTADLTFDFGLTEYYKGSDVKLHSLWLNGGIKL